MKQQYAKLLDEITQLGFILSGTITERLIIGKKGKKQINKKKYGPYYQWTRKVQGKTVTKNLSTSQASLYRQAIDNNKKIGSFTWHRFTNEIITFCEELV